MQPVNLLTYTSYISFLKDYYLYKKNKNSHFNYTVWSQKLKLANVSILTRILNGDRSPGPQLSEAFSNYFQFSQKEKEYFTTLIRLEKETDLGLRELYLQKLLQLRQSEPIAVNPLTEFTARNLALWGSANGKKFNDYLRPFGFEGILSYGSGTSSICLNGAIVDQSAWGPYSQFAFAAYTKRKDQILAESEMFFCELYSSDLEVVTKFQTYGSPYQVSDMMCDLSLEKEAMIFELKDEEGPTIKLQMTKTKETLEEADQPNMIYGYNKLLGPSRGFQMVFKSRAYYRPFDSQSDICWWKPDSELGRALSEIEFRPVYWTYQPQFHAVIHPHVER